MRFLAQIAGMELPENDTTTYPLRQKILEINRLTARYFFDCLGQEQGKPALQYLRGRGLSTQTISRFGLGYAPNSWDAIGRYLAEKGYTTEELAAAGILAKGPKGHYSVFRGRVMFPIIDLRGNVVAFGGRSLGQDQGPKYLNSGDTPVFKKSRNLFAMNIAKASKRKELLLCEGYMDVIAVHQAQFDNAVATLGTALTAEQARLIAQYRDTVTIAYDSDAPGQAATQRACTILGEVGIKTRILSITGAKDPDEYIKTYGAERFGLLIDGAATTTDFAIEKLKGQFDLESADGKVSFMQGFVKLLLGLQNAVERDVYISRIAQDLSIQKEAIYTELKYRQSRYDRKKQKEAQALPIYGERPREGTTTQTYDPQRAKNKQAAAAEDRILSALLCNPDYYGAIKGVLTAEDFVTEQNRIFAKLIFERLEQGQSTDLSLLGETLDVEQIGRLSALITSAQELTFTQADLSAYAQRLLDCREKKSKSQIAAMTDDDLGAYIASLASKKQKNS